MSNSAFGSNGAGGPGVAQQIIGATGPRGIQGIQGIQGETGPGGGDFYADGSVPMTGNLDLGGNNIINGNIDSNTVTIDGGLV